MLYTKIPYTDIQVSKICLGTMTFGEQNTQEQGFEQMDYAIDNGINFFDTAEMYAIPGRKETYGSTEKIIGNWFKQSGKRDQVVLASKIVGPNPYFAYMRENIDFTPQTIRLAVEQSLSRLQTDYIDIYQLHWPERKTNYFGQRGFVAQDDNWTDNINQVLHTLQALIAEGKIKHIGLSNENPWGIMRFLEESKYNQLPRIVTVQNPYSLLNRLFEVGSAEVCHRENIGLLAYSPLGFGVLSGKYIHQKQEANSRLSLFPQYSRYSNAEATQATQKYLEVAQQFGLNPAQMALAFVNQQPFVYSNIIGATKMEQLIENVQSINVNLTAECLAEINKIHQAIPDPAP